MLVCKNAELAVEDRGQSRPHENVAVRLRGSRQAMEISFLDMQILLAMQSLSAEASGAAIVEELHKNGRPIQWRARVYAALQRLEREGLISKTSSEPRAQQRRGRRRSTIALTTSGRLILRQSLQIIDMLRQERKPATPDLAAR